MLTSETGDVSPKDAMICLLSSLTINSNVLSQDKIMIMTDCMSTDEFESLSNSILNRALPYLSMHPLVDDNSKSIESMMSHCSHDENNYIVNACGVNFTSQGGFLNRSLHNLIPGKAGEIE